MQLMFLLSMHKPSIDIPAVSHQQYKMATYVVDINITTLVNISEKEDIRSLAKQFLMYKVGKHDILLKFRI